MKYEGAYKRIVDSSGSVRQKGRPFNMGRHGRFVEAKISVAVLLGSSTGLKMGNKCRHLETENINISEGD